VAILSSNLGGIIHLFSKRISEVSRVQTSTPAYNNVCPCQLNYSHGNSVFPFLLARNNKMIKKIKLIVIKRKRVMSKHNIFLYKYKIRYFYSFQYCSIRKLMPTILSNMSSVNLLISSFWISCFKRCLLSNLIFQCSFHSHYFL